jgi:hypothetical protein
MSTSFKLLGVPAVASLLLFQQHECQFRLEQEQQQRPSYWDSDNMDVSNREDKKATAMMQPNNYDACKRREARISNSTRE